MSRSAVSGQQPRDGAQAIEFEFHEEKKHTEEQQLNDQF
jgi:hypothetical protein